jgi:hypothetical protein
MIDRPIMTEQTVFWHRSLPPFDAELVGEHTIEADSSRVAGTLAHRDELWDRCYRDLMEATGEAWLHGRFDYMLYRRSAST